MIYFDNAATTYPKPPEVVDAVRRCILMYGGNAGRGAHRLARRAAECIFECRALCAQMFGASDESRVFFTPNTTYGINAVIKGLLHRGDHVLISELEHNAVYRPIYKLAKEGIIEYDVFPAFVGEEDREEKICASVEGMIRPNTRLVFCTHASNICSAMMPIERLGEICEGHGVLFSVDGAQSGGHEEINIGKMHIDALCLPGHKGLYGPQGSGLVVLGEDIVLDTLTEGGNGIESLSPEMAIWAPERYEAGTLPAPSIAGLYAGLSAVKREGIESIARTEEDICAYLTDMLMNTRGVSVYAPEHAGSILLFNVNDLPSEVVADELDRHGICVRGGFHCAALAHAALGTPDTGAVRLSFGMYNTRAEAQRLYKVLKNEILT